jgi:hypothetical protein
MAGRIDRWIKRGVLQLLGVQLLGLLHFDEPCLLDADRGDVRHDRQHAEIFFGEFVNQVRGVEINQSDDAVLGLQRSRQHAADVLLQDAHSGRERLVGQRIANQQRAPLADDQVAHQRADAKARALDGARPQLSALERHEDPARGADRFHRQVQNQVEQLLERHVAGQFAPRSDQRLHMLRAWRLASAQQTAETSLHGGRDRRRRPILDEHHWVVLNLEHHRQLPELHAVTSAKRTPSLDANSIDECSVGAAQVVHHPIGVFAFEHGMLARKSGDARIAQLVRFSAAQPVTVALQHDGRDFSVRSVDR